MKTVIMVVVTVGLADTMYAVLHYRPESIMWAPATAVGLSMLVGRFLGRFEE